MKTVTAAGKALVDPRSQPEPGRNDNVHDEI